MASAYNWFGEINSEVISCSFFIVFLKYRSFPCIFLKKTITGVAALFRKRLSVTRERRCNRTRRKASPTYEKGSMDSGRDVIHRKVHEGRKMEQNLAPGSRITRPTGINLLYLLRITL